MYRGRKQLNYAFFLLTCIVTDQIDSEFWFHLNNLNVDYSIKLFVQNQFMKAIKKSNYSRTDVSYQRRLVSLARFQIDAMGSD